MALEVDLNEKSEFDLIEKKPKPVEGRKPFWESRKWWFAILAVILPIVSKVFMMEISDNVIIAVEALLGIAIGAEATIDTKKLKKDKEAVKD